MLHGDRLGSDYYLNCIGWCVSGLAGVACSAAAWSRWGIWARTVVLTVAAGSAAAGIWFATWRSRRATLAITSTALVRDLHQPLGTVNSILTRTTRDLRKLSTLSAHVDARPIINRAVQELSRIERPSTAMEIAIMEHYLSELSDQDYEVLRLFKLGKKHSEIASLMSMNVESVRSSLVSTYSELRMRLMGCGGGDGGGEPLPIQYRLAS